MDISVSEGWVAADQICLDIDISASTLTFQNSLLTRQKQNHDTHVWIKLCCQSLFTKIGLKKFVVHSNARFVELYFQEEKSLTYVSTIRGATVSDRFVFELDFETQLRFNQLHLKFLSIKSHSAKPFEKDFLELKISFLELYLEPDHNLQCNEIVSNIPCINGSNITGDNIIGDNGSFTNGEINKVVSAAKNTANNIQPTNSSATNTTTHHQKVTTSTAEVPPTNTRPPGGMDIRDMLLQEMNKSGISPSGTNHYTPAAVGNSNNGNNGNIGSNNGNNGSNSSNHYSNNSNGNNGTTGGNNGNNNNNNNRNSNNSSGSNNGSTNGPFAGQSTAQLMTLMLQMKSSILSEFSGILDAKLTPVINRLDRIESNVSKIQDALFNADISSA